MGIKRHAFDRFFVVGLGVVAVGLGIGMLLHPAPVVHSMIAASVLPQPVGLKIAIPKLRNPSPVPAPVGELVAPSEPGPLAPASPKDAAREDAAYALKMLRIDVTPDALAAAVRDNLTARVLLLLKAGIDPNSYDSTGNPILSTACKYDRVALAVRLMQAGANPNFTGVGSRTPLMEAAATGDTDLLDALIQNGAAVDFADEHGHSALSYAIFARTPAAIAWLLTHGASLSESCCGGKESTFAHALESADPAIIEPVINYVHPTHWSQAAINALLTAIRRGDRPVTRLLITHHPVLPAPPHGRQSIVAYAIAWGGEPLLRFLLECGANPNVPLQRPVESAFTRLLHDENLEFYAQKEDGVTPLMVASALGNLDMVQLLLKNGAKRGMVTSRSKMAALSLAAHHNFTDVMQVLLGKSPRPEDQHVHVEISLGMQEVSLWKDGHVVLTSHISTGRDGYRTPTGRFVITDKQRVRTSSIYKVSMPYFMRLSCSEVGMHAGVVPNFPASHGCIRLPESAAIKIYHAVDEGTLVMVDP